MGLANVLVGWLRGRVSRTATGHRLADGVRVASEMKDSPRASCAIAYAREATTRVGSQVVLTGGSAATGSGW
jgi:hypothetical protein